MEEPGARPVGAGLMSRTSTSPRPLWQLIALGAVLIALVAGAVLSGLDWRRTRAAERDGHDAVAAARAEVLALTTVSAATTEDDIDRLLAGATSGFRDELERQTDAFREALVSADVTSTGEVVSAGLTALEDGTATVLVAASGTVANAKAKQPEPRNYRMRVDLTKVRDRWLVSGLEFVG
jgi:Mce-associated membrane protein